VSEVTFFPEKRERTKNRNPESKDAESEGSVSRESCWNIMNFFKLLEEMDREETSEKSGRNNCKGPVGSKIEYSYHVKINNPEMEVERSWKPISQKPKIRKRHRG